MRVSAMLVRWCAGPAGRPRSGQIIILFALFLTAALGLVGLAVDVGHAYERRQFVQGAANNAARAGAFEVYTNHITLPAWTTSAADQASEDSAVVARMVDTLASSGLTVKNAKIVSGKTTLTSPSSWSACSQNLPINSVYMQAVYLDGSTPPTTIYLKTDPAHTPVQVGFGGFPTAAGGYSADAQGVQVTQLVTCVPHFFVGVLRFGNFNVGSNAFLSVSGLAETHSSTSSANGGVAPFYAFARKCDPATDPNHCADPYTLYMPGAPDSRIAGTYQDAPSGCGQPPITTPCSGDLVTIHDHSNGQGNWDAYQFVTPADGEKNVPSPALPLGSGSNRGCLDPNATNLSFGVWSFNRPGNGSHCGTSPSIGSVVVVPLVDYVCKNDSCGVTAAQDPTNTIGTCVSGGFCARVVAFVQITITQDLTTGKLVQGYITKVIQDPLCTVQAPVVGGISQHPPPPSTLPPSQGGLGLPSSYGLYSPGDTWPPSDAWPTCP